MSRRPLVVLAAALAIAAGSASALGQVGTAFTYQGQLKNAGSNVNSATDMQFSLWTLAVGGTQVGSTVTQTAVSVSQGLFTTTVDFGVSPYTSSQALYLQIAVRNPAGSGSYVPMGSRQQLTAAPFSMATRGINVDGAGNALIGATSVGASPGRVVAQGAWTTGSGKVVLNPTNWGASGPSGDGAGLISITDGAGGERGFLGVSGSPSVDTVLTATGGGTQLRLGGGALGIGFYTIGGTNSLSTFNAVRPAPAMVLDQNGRLGIGNAGPSSTLDVVGNGPIVAGTSAARAIRAQSQQPWGSAIGIDAANIVGGKVWDLFATGGTAGEGQGKFILRNDTDFINALTITSNAKVGIGVNNVNPGSMLDVRLSSNAAGDAIQFGSQTYCMGRLGEDAGTNTVWLGNVRADGPVEFRIGNSMKARVNTNGVFEVKTLQIDGGSDLVEGFDSQTKDIEPGTLMVIDPAHPGQLMPSSAAYDTRVAGIISGAAGIKSGLKMGQEGVMDGKHPIAMTGRVYVKCTTAGGAIQPGDLLTTSDLPGYAMKASDRSRAPGAVIGKAMSGLEKDTGLVLVLVNLQ